MRRIVWTLFSLTALTTMGVRAAGQTAAPAPRNAPQAQARPKAATQGTPAKPQEARIPKPAVPPLSPAEIAARQKKMDDLLVRWEASSKKVTQLDVHMTRIDRSENWPAEWYDGRAILKAPHFAMIDFRAIEIDPATKKPVKGPDGKAKSKAHQKVICDGSNVWEYKDETKQIFIFPLGKEQKEKALLEGPLPFLFNMRAAEATKRYKMTWKEEKNDATIIEIVPRLDIDRDSFSRALVRLNNTTLMPDAMILYDPNGNDWQEYSLDDVRPNAKINDDNFKGVMLAGWKVEKNSPTKPGAATPATAPASADPASRQPSARRAPANPPKTR
ncbi:outer-membrane lipoprotein carrier protein LolA [Isosphaeraceae bacterium EP7]